MTANPPKTAATYAPVHPKLGSHSAQIMLGTPTLGIIRIEWHNAMVGMTTPPNFSLVRSTPCGYPVADAQNLIIDVLLKGPFRALILIEDDTCPPPHALMGFDAWLWKMERKKAPPVVSGLYHIKGSAESRRGKKGGIELLGPEPLVYRGDGQRAYRDWSQGDVVWCSGIPTGALLVHRAVLEAWAREPDVESYLVPGHPTPIKRIFQNPSRVWTDPDTGGTHVSAGTSDLWWSAQTIERGILQKAGWGAFYQQARIRNQTANGAYPYVVDTAIRFSHVDRATGAAY